MICVCECTLCGEEILEVPSGCSLAASVEAVRARRAGWLAAGT